MEEGRGERGGEKGGGRKRGEKGEVRREGRQKKGEGRFDYSVEVVSCESQLVLHVDLFIHTLTFHSLGVSYRYMHIHKIHLSQVTNWGQHSLHGNEAIYTSTPHTSTPLKPHTPHPHTHIPQPTHLDHTLTLTPHISHNAHTSHPTLLHIKHIYST